MYSPPVNRITDRCKNITFAISLRTVKKKFLQIRTSTLEIEYFSAFYCLIKHAIANVIENIMADFHKRRRTCPVLVCRFFFFKKKEKQILKNSNVISMGFYFYLVISLEKHLRKIKICQVTFSRKKKKLEKPTNKLRHGFSNRLLYYAGFSTGLDPEVDTDAVPYVYNLKRKIHLHDELLSSNSTQNYRETETCIIFFHVIFDQNCSKKSQFGSWHTPWKKIWIRHWWHWGNPGSLSDIFFYK